MYRQLLTPSTPVGSRGGGGAGEDTPPPPPVPLARPPRRQCLKRTRTCGATVKGDPRVEESLERDGRDLLNVGDACRDPTRPLDVPRCPPPRDLLIVGPPFSRLPLRLPL